jgi:hypothetical protein
MNNQIVAGLHDVQGHRPSHGAQSDKCNFQRIILSISAGIMRRFRHFGGFWTGYRSRAGSSGPEKAPVWVPHKAGERQNRCYVAEKPVFSCF